MTWIWDLVSKESAAQAAVILGIVAAVGIAIGSVHIKGIGLGIAGVLFAGLAGGHVLHHLHGADGNPIHLAPAVIEFAREFGLILFVYTIGVQVGPGFFDSLRRNGLPLNIMAACIVVFGLLLTVGVHKIGKVPLPAAVGIFSGATTNTPSLAASGEAMRSLTNLPPDSAKLPALGYAVAYPFGIVGIILTMLIIRVFFKISITDEAKLLAQLNANHASKLSSANLEVKNTNLAGLPISRIPLLHDSPVTISRILHGGQPQLATPDMTLNLGDVLLAVGPRAELDELKLVVGEESKIDLRTMPSNLSIRRVIVTRSAALGQTIDALDLLDRFGVTVTRIARAEIELPPTRTRLQFGDSLLMVGEPKAIEEATAVVGNSVKRLNHPQVIAVFVGIVLGVLVGSIPFSLPGVPAPVKLGLAGGPLLVAIILSRVGHIGPMVWHLPIGANLILRELGIVLFLAAVGLKSGDTFVETVLSSSGVYWMWCGALITFVPLITVALVARAIYDVNFLTLCGLLSGSMTDPPALQFAQSITGSDAPAVSYATVYPLVMLLRVLGAQILVLVLGGKLTLPANCIR